MRDLCTIDIPFFVVILLPRIGTQERFPDAEHDRVANDYWYSLKIVDREIDLEWFACFDVQTRWRFAKTYVDSYPHEYTLDEWCDDDQFARAIGYIERWGVAERFWSARRQYLHVGERMYWHMGDVTSSDSEQQPCLINRSFIDIERYGPEAERLGYRGSELDALVERWKELLEKARRGNPQGDSSPSLD